MQRNNIMKCLLLCMRVYFTAMPAPMIKAATADADMLVLVHAPYSNPDSFMAVDMAHKNSVIAEYRKPTLTGSHSPVKVSE
jgi:hypothetical protein